MFDAVAARRSVRAYGGRAPTLAETGQLLWAAQGITDPDGKRAAPSAGALYPLELYVADRTGLHRYRPSGHRLVTLSHEDRRVQLAAASGHQDAVGRAPLLLVITAVAARTAARYGDRAERFVTLEAGHAAHGILLTAVALGLGAVTIGSFGDDELGRALRLPAAEAPRYIIAVGDAVGGTG